MSEATFLETVMHGTNLDSASAAREATKATLETLGERLSRGEVEDVGEYLPSDFRAWLLESESSAQTLTAEGFLERVAEREGTSKPTAHRHARSVLQALESEVPEVELFRARTQLPDEYEAFL